MIVLRITDYGLRITEDGRGGGEGVRAWCFRGWIGSEPGDGDGDRGRWCCLLLVVALLLALVLCSLVRCSGSLWLDSTLPDPLGGDGQTFNDDFAKFVCPSCT